LAGGGVVADLADAVFVSDSFFQAEDGIRDATVTGVQTCALPISRGAAARARASGRAARVSRRDARPTLRPGGRPGSARRGAADAHLPTRRRRPRLRRARLEGVALTAGALPSPP